jgi:glycosyltransferase involved in cell wall biosynthesis
MRVATDVLFVSPSLAREAQRRGLLDGRKSWAIGQGSSNGVLAHEVAARAAEVDRDELRAQFGFGPDDYVVGFVGRITYDKGVDKLIEAFARVTDPRIRLLCIGEAEDEALAAQIEVLGDRVHRVGWTNDLWGHLAAIDTLCLPTLREGFPNVVLEASSVGLPTITTRATGAVDSVVDGVTGLLYDAGDTDALLQHIHTLANDPELRERMGAAARERVLTEFQPERIWSGVEEILSGAADPQIAHRVSGA